MNRSAIGLFFLFCSQSLFAQTSTADTAIKDLSLCDATIFRTIKKYESDFRLHGPVESGGNIAYLKVLDRTAEDKNVVIFEKAIESNVSLIGYFDEVADLEAIGQYYSWGFLVNGGPDSVVAAIKPLVSDGSRLRRDGNVFVRSEIRDITLPNGGWIKNDKLSSGKIPRNHAIERVFLVEPAGDKYPGISRVGCSLQGAIPVEILASERPDIEAKELSSSSMVAKSETVPPFGVGDVIVPYRHYDSDKKELMLGAERGSEGTKWKVLEIAKTCIRLTLIEGEFKPWWANGKTYMPSTYTDCFFSSGNFKSAFPESGDLDQIFSEYRKSD